MKLAAAIALRVFLAASIPTANAQREWSISDSETKFQVIAGATWEFTDQYDCGGNDRKNFTCLRSHSCIDAYSSSVADSDERFFRSPVVEYYLSYTWSTGGVIQENAVTQRQWCAQKCLDNPQCVAFNYVSFVYNNCIS